MSVLRVYFAFFVSILSNMALVALLEEQEIRNTHVHVYKILLNFFCQECRSLDVQTPKMLVATSINYNYKQRTVELNEEDIFNLIVILTKV